MIIYKITNLINGKIYIGQTIRSLQKRWTDHKCSGRSASQPLYKAIRKYGIENFKIEEIDGANSLSELNYKEWLLIFKFNSLVPDGYNLQLGGKNAQKHISTKKALSKKMKDRWESPIFSNFMSENMTERWKNIDYRDHIVRSMTNYEKTDEHKENIRVGKLKQLEREFFVYDINSKKLIGVWKNILQCSLDLKIHKTNIWSMLNGQRNKVKNYIFCYDQSLLSTCFENAVKKTNPVTVHCANTGEFVGSWNAQKDCAIALGIKDYNISKALKSKRKTHKNYIFEYVDK